MRKTNPPAGRTSVQFRKPFVPEGFSLQQELQRIGVELEPVRKKLEKDFAQLHEAAAKVAAGLEQSMLSLQQEFQREIQRKFRPGEFERAIETMVLVCDLSFPETSPQQRNAAAQTLASRLTAYLANPRARRALLDKSQAKSLKAERAQDLLKSFFITGLLLAGQDDAWSEQKIRHGSRGKTAKLIPANLAGADFYRWLLQRARFHAEKILLEEHSTASDSDKIDDLITESTPDSLLRDREASRDSEALVSRLLKIASKQEAWLLRLALREDGELIKVLERFDKTPDATRKFRERLRKKLLKITTSRGRKKKPR